MAKAKEDENVSELQILVKADVQGSAEAIVQAMEKIGNEEVRVRVLHYGVAAITNTDVSLAEASNASVIGFNVRANASARQVASQKGVEVRYYSVIYDLVDDVKAAASGLLSAEIRENFIGYAQIKEVFKVRVEAHLPGIQMSTARKRPVVLGKRGSSFVLLHRFSSLRCHRFLWWDQKPGTQVNWFSSVSAAAERQLECSVCRHF